MEPTNHIEANSVLPAPPGVSIEQCVPLYVRRMKYEDGTPSIKSFWKPSDQELEYLLQGGVVTLTVLGTMHPMVIVGAQT